MFFCSALLHVSWQHVFPMFSLKKHNLRRNMARMVRCYFFAAKKASPIASSFRALAGYIRGRLLKTEMKRSLIVTWTWYGCSYCSSISINDQPQRFLDLENPSMISIITSGWIYLHICVYINETNKYIIYILTGWWFEDSPPFGEDEPILTSIFFKGVGSTTN